MKVLVHTLDHNQQYRYFRQSLQIACGDSHDIYFFVQKDVKGKKRSFVERISAELKILRISRKRKELFIYLFNRTATVFFRSYKRHFDLKKLRYIDNYFSGKVQKIPETPKTMYIENINQERERIKEIAPDIMVVFGGPYINQTILSCVKKTINIHLGFLPDYRGIKSVEWAILHDQMGKVGYTIHEMTKGLDSGAIISRGTLGPALLQPLNFGQIYSALYEEAFRGLFAYLQNIESIKSIKQNQQQSVIYNNYRMGPWHYRKLIEMTEQKKLAIFAGNPVQYHAPIYRALDESNVTSLFLLFGSDIGAKKFYSKEFNALIEWDVPVMEGYLSKIFFNIASRKWKGFFSRINPGMFFHFFFNRYDAVLIHGYDTFSSWLVFLSAKLTGVKIIWRGEAIIRPSAGDRLVKNFVKQTVLPRYFSACDAVAYSCTANKEYLQQFGIDEDKMFFVPCSVDNEFFQAEKKKYDGKNLQLRRELDIAEDDIVVLYVARMTKRKRPYDLVNAVNSIENNNITILFVGDGPERRGLEKLVAQYNIKAKFVGFQGQKELPRYYTIADVFMILAEYDASPKALNEALNFALPIIASDTVGTARDLVIDGDNGFIVGSGDEVAIADKIQYFEKNREQLQVMGNKSSLFLDKWSAKEDASGIIDAMRYSIENSR